ncbi:cytochrome P450 4C1-like [Hetaerina americana]|uniref:cytochrome P450 4C1-like n=1 Tax=Hetaerina americana TaxID=62018 RepID=UPI003A7F2E9F
MESVQSFFVLCISILVTALVLKQAKKWLLGHLRMSSAMKNVPGPDTFPILGNALDFIIRPQNQYLNEIERITKAHHPLFRLWNGPFLCTVHTSSWKYAEKIFNNSVHIEKYMFYEFLQPWLGTGLLTSTGDKWHSRRKLLTPGFHRAVLDSTHDVITEKSAQLIEILESKGKASQAFDIAPLIWQCSLDIICETAMGTKMNLQSEIRQRNVAYTEAVKEAMSSFVRRCVRPWLHPKIIHDLSPTGRKFNKCVKIMHNFTDKVIKTRKEEYSKLLRASMDNGDGKAHEARAINTKRKAFLDILIEAAYPEGYEKKPILSDEDIREEVSTFMFEGHDTTASAIAWTLYLLGHHPDIQEKVFEEVERVFGSNLVATSEKVSELRLLERCIKESLRLYPSVPFIGRKLKEDLNLGEYTIPSNTGVFVLIYFLHRDPEIFPQPEKFNPDNFLPQACEKRPPYAYVPFSAGPRNCIGQKFAMIEEKIVLSHILKNFRIESIDKPQDLKVLIDVIIRAEDGIKIRLHPRM